MEKVSFLTLALIGLAEIATQHTNAGSVVSSDSHGHNIYVCGHPEKICEKMAFDEATRRGWANERIIAFTDIAGYGAIATARHPNGYGSMIGVALSAFSFLIAMQLTV